MKQKTISEPATKEDLNATKNELKNELSNYSTKEDLKNILSNYSTKQDLKNELEKYATKEDLKNELEKAAKLNRADTRFIVNESERRLEDKMVQFRDMILTAIDPLLKELEERRQDREISAEHTYEMRQQLDDHEKRLSKLEHS